MELKHPVAVSPDQWRVLLAILAECLPGVRVWAFGSRVNGTAKRSSDLDLVAFAEATELPQVGNAREALEESSLPFRVDLHVWSELPPTFQENIRERYEDVQPGLEREAGT